MSHPAVVGSVDLRRDLYDAARWAEIASSQHCLMVTLDTSPPPYIGRGIAGNLLDKEVNKDIRSGGTGDCWGWDHLRRDS